MNSWLDCELMSVMSVAVVGSYDNFNALQAQKYYEWAASDPRIIGALATRALLTAVAASVLLLPA